MVVVPLAASGNKSAHPATTGSKADSKYWVRIVAAGSLAASGVLLMTGKRRAGLAMAITGTIFTAIDQQEVVRGLWNNLPNHLEEVQGVLSRVQTAVDDLTTQGERLRDILNPEPRR